MWTTGVLLVLTHPQFHLIFWDNLGEYLDQCSLDEDFEGYLTIFKDLFVLRMMMCRCINCIIRHGNFDQPGISRWTAVDWDRSGIQRLGWCCPLAEGYAMGNFTIETIGNAVKCLQMVVEAMASCRFSIYLLWLYITDRLRYFDIFCKQPIWYEGIGSWNDMARQSR